MQEGNLSRVYPELVQARFPKGLFARLIAEAEAEEVMVSQYVRDAVKQCLNGNEPLAAGGQQ